MLCCIHANLVNVLFTIMLQNIAPALFNYCRKLRHSCYQYMIYFLPWYRFLSKQLLWRLISSCSIFLCTSCSLPSLYDTFKPWPIPVILSSLKAARGDRWQCVVDWSLGQGWVSFMCFQVKHIPRCKPMNWILDGGWSNKTFPITWG